MHALSFESKSSLLKTSLVATMLIGLLTLLYASVAWASTFTVTNTADSGAGSLRAAIEEANANAGVADQIVFADGVSGTITLRSQLPTVTEAEGLTIDGGGDVKVSGNSSVRVFEVGQGAKLTLKNLTVADGEMRGDCSQTLTVGGGILNAGTLTVTNSAVADNEVGDPARCPGFGGGIFNGGTLTVTNSIFSGNSTDFTFDQNPDISGGGGIYNAGTAKVAESTFAENRARDSGGGIHNAGTLEVTDSTFSGNSGLFSGGGITNRGTLEVTDSTFSDNDSSAEAGGIYHDGHMLKVTDSTFSGNSGRFIGGAISNRFSVNPVRIMGSTFSANSASEGGAIFHNRFSLEVTNSTFYANMADIGGAIVSTLDEDDPDTLEVTNSTFSANIATGGGSAIFKTGSATLRNTIVANNASVGNCSDPVADGGYNVSDDGSCGFDEAKGSLSNTDPLLDPAGLQDNGGPTPTIALQPDSPAVDLVGQEACPPPESDQRGVERPQGEACDSGAFELEQEPPQPQTKAECKKGGYKEFGFKNQGRCIAFVNKAASNN